jgi:hypothetical protein
MPKYLIPRLDRVGIFGMKIYHMASLNSAELMFKLSGIGNFMIAILVRF